MNPTNNKTLVSSVLVAATQVGELCGKALHILTASPTLKKIIEHLPLTHIQGYKDSNNQCCPKDKKSIVKIIR
jgi:hypothetical protein